MTQDHPSDKDSTAGPLPGSEAGLPGRNRPRTDWVVFGVTAALTLAFVLWGPSGRTRWKTSRPTCWAD